jgi:hypothetical protein
MYASLLSVSSLVSVTGSTICGGTTGATGAAGSSGQVGKFSYTAGGAQSIPIKGQLNTLIAWSTQDLTQSIGTTGVIYNYEANPAGTFTNTTTITLSLNIEYTLNL